MKLLFGTKSFVLPSLIVAIQQSNNRATIRLATTKLLVPCNRFIYIIIRKYIIYTHYYIINCTVQIQNPNNFASIFFTFIK
jgi:hypothetical protein